MSLSSVADTLYAARFLKLLVTPWEETEAFELGLIDEKGKKLKRPTTSEEKSAYTLFHRLVFNIKRIIPYHTMNSKFSSYAAAVYLVKEYMDLGDAELRVILEEAGVDLTPDVVTESWIAPDEELREGTYTLVNVIAHPATLELIGHVGSHVMVESTTAPVANVMGSNIYPVKHINTQQTIYVTLADLAR